MEPTRNQKTETLMQLIQRDGIRFMNSLSDDMINLMFDALKSFYIVERKQTVEQNIVMLQQELIKIKEMEDNTLN